MNPIVGDREVDFFAC